MDFLSTLSSWLNQTMTLDTHSIHNTLHSFISSTTTHLSSLKTTDIQAFPSLLTDLAKNTMQLHLHPRGLGPNPHGSEALRNRLHVAHGTIASVTIVILFPSVAIFLRVIRSRHIVRLHYTLQIFNLCLLALAFSLGVWLSWLDDWLWHWPHQVLGTVIFVLFLFQPILGTIQHRQFLRTGVRTIYASLHVWYGRLLITLGIINGGLGLKLADKASWGAKAAYITVAIVMLILYTAAQVLHHSRMKKAVRTRSVKDQEGNKEDWAIV